MSKLPQIVSRFQADILSHWLAIQSAGDAKVRSTDNAEVSRRFFDIFKQALSTADLRDIHKPEWSDVRDLLSDFSRQRVRHGYTPTETATFVFSLKQPLFTCLSRELAGEELTAETWTASALLDSLGLFTVEAFQKEREEIIARQQAEMLELSTPVVRLWEGVLALPLIGTLDSERTQTVMENLLQKIVDTGAGIAIIDITGVPTVDTLVAQHLLKTVAAARLMGADCIISGIRPQIAQTIVHLGVSLGDVSTKATLADAFSLALSRTGFTMVRPSS
jgi:rsbT co-antagonist protein RsbR